MLKRVWSDLATFRAVSFTLGMNVVLADREKDSDATDTTNGVGKTTLLRIIQFCLGSDFSTEKVLDHPDLHNTTFSLDFDWAGHDCAVSRNTAADKYVTVSKIFLEGLPVEILDERDGRARISLEDWKFSLSKRFYPEAAVSDKKFGPSFRDIAHYFLRLGKSAYSDPLTAFQQQPGASKRISASFLLRLNWAKQRELVEEQHKRDQNSAAIKALRGAEETKEILTIGELEAMRVASELKVRQRRSEIAEFKVREDYREVEEELQRADRSLHEKINQNFSDKRLLEFYKDSSKETPDADPTRALEVFEDAGAIFKEGTLRTVDAVLQFHESVYRNRRDFLAAEVRRISAVVKRRSSEISRLIAEKESLLNILSNSGALETLVELQQSFNDLNAEHEVLVAKIEERKRFDRRNDELAARIASIKTLMKSDLDDRKSSVDEVRELFADFTRTLYGEPGLLSVDVGKAGYQISFAIDRSGSEGVDQMVVFCFDLAVATVWAKQRKGFGVWIHDSSLFADVDPRQYAAALKLAAQKSAEFGFQYICCLNIGSLPTSLLEGFDLDKFVRLRLSDKGSEGRLLGMRLPPRDQPQNSAS
jgi:uncharacterized protein YydD (DUF2326 family)